MRPIVEVAGELGIPADGLMPFGPYMAKVTPPALRALEAGSRGGKIVLVSAINPTKFGEGKTTCSIGLQQGLRRRGQRAALALREPSLGPIFGAKGGGTGGGRARLEPSARINMHFTGDLHAVTAAHNLLAALCDNALHFPGAVELDPRKIVWKRVLDLNDRFLRKIVIGLGGGPNGVPREDGFDITASSEVMAILCLAKGVRDLKDRLGRVVVAFDRKGDPVTAAHLQAVGAMAALLGDALLPNLVQTCEGGPAFVHGGPFGNIAHGCNSVAATRAARAAADYAITEAGFGFDLGGEKFFHIKCRDAGIWPRAVVLVASARALRLHGGDPVGKASGAEAVAALERGFGNLEQHLAGARAFGFDPVVAINCFPGDTEEELRAIERLLAAAGTAGARFRGYAEGGAGAEELAERVIAACERPPVPPRYLYDLEDRVPDKIRTIARGLYGARDVVFTREAERDLARVRALGYERLPVCMAKTHLSLSDDPSRVGRPSGFDLTVRNVRIAAGAGYLLILTGEIVTMPGLPAKPAAHAIDLGDDGEVTGVV